MENDYKIDNAKLTAVNTAIAADDMQKLTELYKDIPLQPEVAKAFTKSFGVDFMKQHGLDISAAEKKYGKNWLTL